MRLAVVLALILAGLGWWILRAPAAPPPPLISGLADEGLSGAPCPARSLYEQNARRKRGPQPPSAFAERLLGQFPLKSSAAALRDALVRQGFELFSPCANDEGVFGARWRAQSWGEPDGYVYWRDDLEGGLSFLDGHVGRTP
jgi:hypothetical protein